MQYTIMTFTTVFAWFYRFQTNDWQPNCFVLQHVYKFVLVNKCNLENELFKPSPTLYQYDNRFKNDFLTIAERNTHRRSAFVKVATINKQHLTSIYN